MSKIYKAEELVRQRISDASKWAETFIDMYGSRLNEVDTGLMIGWFANAMMTVYDTKQPEIEQLKQQRDAFQESAMLWMQLYGAMTKERNRWRDLAENWMLDHDKLKNKYEPEEVSE